MPTYKNVAPRIVGVHVKRQLVLVEPGRTVDCTEAEADPQVKKGALILTSTGPSSAPAPITRAPAPAPAPEVKPVVSTSPSGRTSRPKAEPKE